MPHDLSRDVATFVNNLSRTIRGALPHAESDPFRVLTDRLSRHLTVRQTAPEGFQLDVEGRALLNLKISFQCTTSRGGDFLSIAESKFDVLFYGLTEPLLRFHFRREQSPGLPTAHLHVHAARDEVVAAMLGGVDRGRVRSRLAGIPAGRYPRLAALHLPLGGPRFRPGVEDVLQMLRSEFEIDVLPTFDDAVDTGRSVYRQLQLMTAVNDDPLTAAAELERIGFVVTSPEVAREARPARY